MVVQEGFYLVMSQVDVGWVAFSTCLMCVSSVLGAFYMLFCMEEEFSQEEELLGEWEAPAMEDQGYWSPIFKIDMDSYLALEDAGYERIDNADAWLDAGFVVLIV